VRTARLPALWLRGVVRLILRAGDDVCRFVTALKGIINKRLTYVELIGSELPPPC
jgi:hypothetical protein